MKTKDTTISQPTKVILDDTNHETLIRVRTIAERIQRHPKCPNYAYEYCRSLANGEVEYVAKQYNRSLNEAVKIQIGYILSNMVAVRDPILKGYKEALNEIHRTL